MGEYRVVLTKTAQKQFNLLPKNVADRIEKKLIALEIDPRPPGSKKLAIGRHIVSG